MNDNDPGARILIPSRRGPRPVDSSHRRARTRWKRPRRVIGQIARLTRRDAWDTAQENRFLARNRWELKLKPRFHRVYIGRTEWTARQDRVLGVLEGPESSGADWLKNLEKSKNFRLKCEKSRNCWQTGSRKNEVFILSKLSIFEPLPHRYTLKILRWFVSHYCSERSVTEAVNVFTEFVKVWARSRKI